jgi:hypothetical protein
MESIGPDNHPTPLWTPPYGTRCDEADHEGFGLACHDVFREDGRWCGWSCSNNVLRAFVVHPRYSRSTQTTKAVQALGRIQDASGKWPYDIPFFLTVNALVHLDSRAAHKQLETAFKRLRRIPNADGTWGRSHREWKTFLAIHALKNKGKLQSEKDLFLIQSHG